MGRADACKRDKVTLRKSQLELTEFELIALVSVENLLLPHSRVIVARVMSL